MMFLGFRLLGCIAVARAIPETMRAAVSTGAAAAGDFSAVSVVDLPVPQPGFGEVLIKVTSSSVNPVDWKLLEYNLAESGPKILGFDVAGTVVGLGDGCRRLSVGDAVWADLGEGSLPFDIQLGAWAEYAIAKESQASLSPSSLSAEGAASLPLVALTDLQAFRMAGAPFAGNSNLTVVVTSGSGGTGIPAIQLARAYGAKRIITSSSSMHFTLLKGLGATDIVDYHTSTIWDTLANDSVDFVYDNYGAPGTADAAMPALRTGGSFVFLPGKGGAVSQNPKTGVTQFNFGLVDPSNYQDLDALADFANAGYLQPVIDQSFSLENIVQALNASFSGHVVGKVAVSVAHVHVSTV